MKKRILALILSVLTIMSLTACKKADNTDKPEIGTQHDANDGIKTIQIITGEGYKEELNRFMLSYLSHDENVENIDKENISKTHLLRQKHLGDYPNFHACKYFIRYFSQHHHGMRSIL